ncbi:MAG TPA: FtsX-like permease family protein [Chthoniobacterales bacterium]|jgi:lipoprotein-releasing system permease protein|nr:FtsX-like permease family protein [Chthoniobacterales bacterium]
MADSSTDKTVESSFRPVPGKIRLPFTYFLALRYLKPKRTFLSLITLISIFGVVLGISVLIIVISVMTGFERELQRKIIGFDADVLISGNEVMNNWREILDRTRKAQGVVAAAPFAQGRVVVQFQNHRAVPWLRGIDPELEQSVANLKQFLVAGEFDLSGDNGIIGSELASTLGVSIGDTVEIYSPHDMGELQKALDEAEGKPDNHQQLKRVRELILPMDITITGMFNSGRYAYDSDYIIVPLHIMQEAYSLGGGVHGIAVRTSDPFTADKVRDRLNRFIEPPFQAVTWIDQNRELFDAIRIERTTMFFVLIFVVIVAAFGIMSTLITSTVQKTREIGLLKALGAQMTQIMWIFLAQGMIVGFFGTLIGLSSGIALVQYRNQVRDFLAATFHIELFPAAVYQFSEIPAEIVPRDVFVICVSGFLICSIAALVPAYFAARLDPVKALRFE